MLRKFVGAAVVVFVMAGIVSADTVNGIIDKVGEKHIHITPFKKADKGFEKGETLKIAYNDKTEVFKAVGFGKKGGKKEPEKSSISDLKAAVKKASEGEGKFKGLFGTVEYEKGSAATKVTYRVFGKGKKGGKGGDKKKDD